MSLNKFYNNKNILITGGTGSVGFEITKYILKNFKINKLILFSRDEQKHFELQKKIKDKRIRFFIGDVRDLDRLNMAFQSVDYVIHAAAQKHVEQSEYNPQECVKTNIYGSQNVISACLNNNVKKCILISTDKAVNPINLYGASKLVAEKIFLNSNYLSRKGSTVFAVIRYGNVLGSKGSIIPFFSELIKENKVIPITDKNMTRFWISFDEAVKFILTSLKNSKAFEIRVPSLNSFKITDLIKIMSPKSKTKIVGIKKGEKIHEELISQEELDITIRKNNVFIINTQNKIKNKKKALLKRYTSDNFLTKKINLNYLNILRNFLSN